MRNWGLLAQRLSRRPTGRGEVRRCCVEPLEARQMLAAQPLISELVAENTSDFLDEDGDSSDWIELFNAGDESIDLDGWFLTDNAGNLDKWRFRSAELARGEFLTVFASGKNRHGEAAQGGLHTNFNLAASGEYLALVQPDGVTIAQEFSPEFPRQRADVSYGLGQRVSGTEVLIPYGATWQYLDDGSNAGTAWRQTNFDDVSWEEGPAELGYGDDDEAQRVGFGPDASRKFITTYFRHTFDVPDASRLTGLLVDLVRDDGAVTYLNGEELARSNMQDGPIVFDTLAQVGMGGADESAVHNFSVGAGDLRSGTNVLAVEVHQILRNSSDISFNLRLQAVETETDQELLFFTTPTPGAPNGAGIVSFVADTSFSHDRGFYDEPFDLQIASATPGATIVYTTNGSAPTATNGTRVAAADDETPPLATLRIDRTTTLRAAAIKSGSEPTNIDTHTYLFTADVIGQSTMSTSITQHPTWGPQIEASLLAVPTVSLVTGNGVSLTERGTSVELIFPDGSEGFQLDGGVEHFGGHSINSPKKSMRLSFKATYGPKKLHYDLFGGDTIDEFDQILLRSGSHDTWFWTHPSGRRGIYVRGRWSSDRQLEMGQPAPDGRWVQVYVDGTYWGMHHLMERPNADFMASYFGGDKEEYDAVNAGSAIDGDLVAWSTMRAATGNWQQLQQYMDATNYADYMILQFYSGNDWDWNHSQNWMAASRREAQPGAGYKFFAWDNDVILRSGLNADNVTRGGPGNMWGAVSSHEEFRVLFADRVQRYFFNDGMFTPDRVLADLDALAERVELPVIAETARWGSPSGYTPDTFRSHLERVKNEIVRVSPTVSRTSVVLGQLRSRGLFPAFDAPAFLVDEVPQYGGTVEAGAELTFQASSGTIYFTANGSDPRLAGGAVSPAALSAGRHVIDNSTLIKARLWRNGEWSALSEAVFLLDTPPSLRISEIMFDPPAADVAAGELDVDNDRFEFLELINVGDVPLDLAGMRMTAGVQFDFGSGSITTLPTGARLVVVRDAEAFASRYGDDVPVAGEFAEESALNNGGDRLRLEAPFSQEIHDFRYNDSWFASTNGDGFALVIRDVDGDLPTWADESAWRAGGPFGGSPGTDDEGLTPDAIVINELLANAEQAAGEWIELHNTTLEVIDLDGWFLSDDAADLTKFQFAAGTSIAAGGYLLVDQSQHFGNAGNPQTRIPFALSPWGGEVFLSSFDPTTGGPGGFRQRVRFAATDSDVTLAHYVNTANYIDFVAASPATRGAANAPVAVPAVVLSEIMYNPGGEGEEFIELHNRGGVDVPLFDPDHPQNTWKFTDGVVFQFPTGVTLGAGEFLLVVRGDPTEFRTARGVPESVHIFGYTGSLENNGEKLELSRPAIPAPDDTLAYIVNERVRYDDRAPWPRTADGRGPSLSRVALSQWGNEPTHWDPGTSGGTPGAVNRFTDTTPPTAPRGLNASLSAEGQLRLQWSAARDAQSGIGRYLVFRDDELIGTTTTTVLVDATINFNISHAYRVAAENGDGLQGPQSQPLELNVTSLQQGTSPTQDYAGTADVELNEQTPTTNMADVTTLRIDADVGGGTTAAWTLIEWDLAGVAVGTDLLGVSITLNVTNASPVDYFVYEATRDWVEGEANWNQFADGQLWQTPGGQGSQDRGSSVLGTIHFNSTGPYTFSLNAGGVEVIQQWIDGTRPNHGFQFSNPANTDSLQFSSSEHATVSARPRLSLSTVTAQSVSRSGDLTGDGFVDFNDLTLLLAHWDQLVSAGQGNLVDPLNTPINFQDLTLLLAAWTGPGPAESPQPAAAEASVQRDTATTESRVATNAHFDQLGRRDDVTLRHPGRRSATNISSANPLRRLQAAAVDRALAEQSTPDRTRIFGRRAEKGTRR